MTWAGRRASVLCRPPTEASRRSRPTGRRGSTRWRRCWQRGLFSSDELRDAIERLAPEEYLAASYYERWLGALELLAAEKGVP